MAYGYDDHMCVIRAEISGRNESIKRLNITVHRRSWSTRELTVPKTLDLQRP